MPCCEGNQRRCQQACAASAARASREGGPRAPPMRPVHRPQAPWAATDRTCPASQLPASERPAECVASGSARERAAAPGAPLYWFRSLPGCMENLPATTRTMRSITTTRAFCTPAWLSTCPQVWHMVAQYGDVGQLQALVNWIKVRTTHECFMQLAPCASCSPAQAVLPD